MALPSWWYNLWGQMSPDAKQAAYNEVYRQVKAAGGTDAQAAAAAAQSVSAQVTKDTGSYASAAGAVITNNGGAFDVALSGLADTAKGIGTSILNVADSAAARIGQTVGMAISGKLILVIAGVAAVLFFWKE